MITTGLSTFFDRRPWTAEKIRFFAQAIEDLDYDLARRAAEKYMREGEFAPVPRDIREIASKLEPVRKLIEGVTDVADRALAFSLARSHDMAPVSVH